MIRFQSKLGWIIKSVLNVCFAIYYACMQRKLVNDNK